jgi:uncharacterized protein (DUF58 family)
MAESDAFLDPASLARIGNYSLMSRLAVEGFLSGLHRSVFHGFGSEFLQYRQYSPGEDLRLIDWKVYSRTERLQTKVFQEETNMNCHLLVDTSASMDYRGERAACSKLRYACILAAIIAHLAIRQGDQAALYLYGESLEEMIPPSRQNSRLAMIHHALSRVQPGGSANHDKVQTYLHQHLRQRGLVILISDMLDSLEVIPPLLARLRARNCDCIAFQVLDPDELDFPREQAARFVDAETGNQCVTHPAAVADAFNKAMQKENRELKRNLRRSRIDFHSFSTRQSVGEALAAFLNHRQRLS